MVSSRSHESSFSCIKAITHFPIILLYIYDIKQYWNPNNFWFVTKSFKCQAHSVADGLWLFAFSLKTFWGLYPHCSQKQTFTKWYAWGLERVWLIKTTLRVEGKTFEVGFIPILFYTSSIIQCLVSRPCYCITPSRTACGRKMQLQ